MNIFAKILPLSLILLILTSCATQWHKQKDAAGHHNLTFSFQNNNSAPKQGIKEINIADLQSGDILFSADSGFNSRIIRLFGNTSVSHAFLYLGDGQIAEAIGSGVHISPIEESIQHSNLLVAYRYPNLNDEQAAKIRQFAHAHEGKHYNILGIIRQSPYTLTRKICELPLIPRYARNFCLNTMAIIQITPLPSHRYFCSQLVIAAYNEAGVPLTHKPPEWISPADILHMRENDVPSITPQVPLQYIGHLRCKTSMWNTSCIKDTSIPSS